MRSKILELGKDTAIYGLSTILGRLLNFLIVPLYANLLLPEENGIITNIYAYIAFVFVLYTYGMEQAYMRFVSSLELGDEKQNFSVPLFSLFGTSLVFSFLIHVNAPTLATTIGLRSEYAGLIQYASWILFFDTLCVVPFASLRMRKKAHVFALFKLINIGTTLIFNVVLLVFVGLRAEGVFIANLISSALTFCLLLPRILSTISFQFSWSMYKEMLRFGIPYIPAGIASMAMQVIDRPIVKAMTDDATLGLYQLNYRLGIFMMLVVGMFDYAWRPFFLQHAREHDAPTVFSRVFSYFALLMSIVFLVVSLFIDDIVRLSFFGKQFFPPLYWHGTVIVPIVLTAYMFSGAYSSFLVGIYLEKKTFYLPLITGVGAVINVIANIVLIPYFNIVGAAIATLLSYSVMAILMYVISQQYYFVPYEWRKVGFVVLSAIAFYCGIAMFKLEPLQIKTLLIKFAAILIYLILISRVGILPWQELKDLLKRVRQNTIDDTNDSSSENHR